MPELLLEILSEEIPARMQAKAADDLKRLVTDAIKEAGLEFSHADAFATPRRLALTLGELRRGDSRMVEATPIASIRIITRFAAVRWRAKNSIIAENIASLLLFIV